MPSDNVELIRRAYEAYSRDDLETMLGFVDPNVERTYLDPNLPQPDPQVCRGRRASHGGIPNPGTRRLLRPARRGPGLHRAHGPRWPDRGHARLPRPPGGPQSSGT